MLAKQIILKIVEADPDIETSRPYRSSKGYTQWMNSKHEWHRVDGPAVIWDNGTKIWMVHNKHHRLDGPAYEGKDGSKMWFVDDKRIPVTSQEEFVNYLLGIKI